MVKITSLPYKTIAEGDVHAKSSRKATYCKLGPRQVASRAAYRAPRLVAARPEILREHCKGHMSSVYPTAVPFLSISHEEVKFAISSPKEAERAKNSVHSIYPNDLHSISMAHWHM